MEDPTKISSRQEKQVKKFVQEYFEKVVSKKREHEQKKAERKAKDVESRAPAASASSGIKKEDDSDGDQDMALSDDEDEQVKQEDKTPVTPLNELAITEGLKRKRDMGDDLDSIKKEESATPNKRLRSETPPPPPPPRQAHRTPEDLLRVSGQAPNNEMSLGDFSRSHQSLPEVEDAMQESPIDGGIPPPPPLPTNTRIAGKNVDILGHVHSPDTPIITSPEDESVERHDQRFSAHRHGQIPEVQVHGGA